MIPEPVTHWWFQVITSNVWTNHADREQNIQFLRPQCCTVSSSDSIIFFREYYLLLRVLSSSESIISFREYYLLPRVLSSSESIISFWEYYLLLRVLSSSESIIFFWEYYLLLRVLSSSVSIIFFREYYLLRRVLSSSESIIFFWENYLLPRVLSPSESIISFWEYYLLLRVLSSSESIISFWEYYLLLRVLSPSESIIFFWEYYLLLRVLSSSCSDLCLSTSVLVLITLIVSAKVLVNFSVSLCSWHSLQLRVVQVIWHCLPSARETSLSILWTFCCWHKYRNGPLVSLAVRFQMHCLQSHLQDERQYLTVSHRIDQYIVQNWPCYTFCFRCDVTRLEIVQDRIFLHIVRYCCLLLAIFTQ